MPNVTAPYRFVPLSNLIVYPDWADKASHDKPFKDGINGELTIELENFTPLCVGGKQTQGTEEKEGEVKFYRTPDGNPAIPATSLKGMLRNVLEIASFSRIKQVEDQKLGVRDLTESNNFYMTKIKNVKSGWLKFDNNQGWVIYPCSHARVHQQQIIDTFDDVNYNTWTRADTVTKRYNLLGICPSIKFEHDKEKNGKKLVNISKTQGSDGVLVVTGQPGQVFDKGKSAKKYEFVFYDTQENPLTVSSTVMSGFLQIHQDTKEWKFWQNNLSNLEHGVPVFYHTDGTLVRSLGLAMMYKLAYNNSIYDAIGHSNKGHTDIDNRADMSDLLFGYLGDNEQQTSGLRGRVFIGLASLNDKNPLLQFSPTTVLSSPQPTYYPAYIRQEKNNRNFSQLMEKGVKIAGWKRYQVKEREEYPTLAPKVLANKKVQVTLETIAPNSKFHFKIRLHNLRPVELGALLWTLDFGKNQNCYHNLGMGKPFGLGSVKLNVIDDKMQLKRNDGQFIEDNSLFLDACRYEFQKYMNEVFQANGIDKKIQWQDCDTIKALYEYATPKSNVKDYQYLPTPKDFSDLKRLGYLNKFIDKFHSFNAPEIDDKSQIQSVDYKSTIDQVIANIKEKELRTIAKENATAEDKALYDIEDFITKAKVEITATMKKNVHKVLKEPFDNYQETFSDEQTAKLKNLTEEIVGLFGNSKQLDKIVKKIKN